MDIEEDSSFLRMTKQNKKAVALLEQQLFILLLEFMIL